MCGCREKGAQRSTASTAVVASSAVGITYTMRTTETVYVIEERKHSLISMITNKSALHLKSDI
jgi:hypothetical protein